MPKKKEPQKRGKELAMAQRKLQRADSEDQEDAQRDGMENRNCKWSCHDDTMMIQVDSMFDQQSIPSQNFQS